MRSINPVFKSRGQHGNYNSGYVGFSYKDNNVISRGIAVFTRGEYKGIVPSHVFYVVDKKKIIEATSEGVHTNDINNYFEDPHCIVFFKKPSGLDSNITITMTEWLYSQLRTRYDYSLLLGFLLKLERIKWLRKYPSLFNSKDAWVCSELISEALYQVHNYRSLSPLSDYHTSKIDPLTLFRSEHLFQPWRFGDD